MCLYAFIGKRFASPVKADLRSKRVKARNVTKFLLETDTSSGTSTQVSNVDSSAMALQPIVEIEDLSPSTDNQHNVEIGDQSAFTNDQGIKLPGNSQHNTSSDKIQQPDPVVYAALLAKIELLEAENLKLKKGQDEKFFRIESIMHDEKLMRFYTGFVNYKIFNAFFEFLGPAKEELNYWGAKECHGKKRSKKIDTKNQLFLTLVKLRLDFPIKDLAIRFGLSTGLTSKYITTWICFLYHHLNEIDWMPTVEQVWATQPAVFKDKFPTTYVIIDGSEVFLETPSDLYMQSSTWSQYKHHNTVKFLVACTPNGCICFMSEVFVGSISDVELTNLSGLLESLEDKPGVAVMADRGFTIKDILAKLNIELNIPPFLDGRKQLSASEVDAGRKIASVRIHVERAINRIKFYRILKGTIPISMARLINQIIFVCAMLTNFQPALIPVETGVDVEHYFDNLSEDSVSDED